MASVAMTLAADLADMAAELERVRAELADVREDLAIVELERDELRGAIVTHRAAINAPHRAGNTYDLALWDTIR
jgi:hypothetical protein